MTWAAEARAAADLAWALLGRLNAIGIRRISAGVRINLRGVIFAVILNGEDCLNADARWFEASRRWELAN
jgi:hypothetical protein